MSKRKNLNDELAKSPGQRRREASGGRFDDRIFDGPGHDDEFYGKGGGSYGGGYKSLAPRCYESHPPMPLPGTDKVIFGGNCSSPVVLDADVYVGLCTSMKHTARSWPWKQGVEFLFSITDMAAPANPDEFRKLINWLKKQVDEGKKVHIGCIGGHGRTGTVLAALVSMYGEPDAIAYVRKHYCKKAVESKVQIDFLHEQFGVKKVEPSKGGGGWSATGTMPSQRKLTGDPSKAVTVSAPREARPIHPLAGAGNIWG